MKKAKKKEIVSIYIFDYLSMGFHANVEFHTLTQINALY